MLAELDCHHFSAFRISLLSNDQLTGSLYLLAGCGIVLCVVKHQFHRVLSAYLLYLIISRFSASSPALFSLHLLYSLPRCIMHGQAFQHETRENEENIVMFLATKQKIVLYHC